MFARRDEDDNRKQGSSHSHLFAEIIHFILSSNTTISISAIPGQQSQHFSGLSTSNSQGPDIAMTLLSTTRKSHLLKPRSILLTSLHLLRLHLLIPRPLNPHQLHLHPSSRRHLGPYQVKYHRLCQRKRHPEPHPESEYSVLKPISFISHGCDEHGIIWPEASAFKTWGIVWSAGSGL